MSHHQIIMHIQIGHLNIVISVLLQQCYIQRKGGKRFVKGI